MITLPTGDKYPPQKLSDMTGKSIQSIYNYAKTGWPKETLELLMLKLDGKIMPPNWINTRFNTSGFLELNGMPEALEYNDLVNVHYKNQVTWQALMARNKQALSNTLKIKALNDEIQQLQLLLNDQNKDQNMAANDPYSLDF